jgi:hypothetical protein
VGIDISKEHRRGDSMIVMAPDLIVTTSDGECLPVPGLEIGVRYRYSDSPSTWSVAQTDGDGVARFHDGHPEMPSDVEVYVGNRFYGTYCLHDCHDVVIEV